MAKKIKGLRVSKDLQEKFKIKIDGTSILGDSTESSHEIKGTGSVTGSMEVEGVATLKDRLSGYTFSPPHIDASTEVQIVQELIDNAARALVRGRVGQRAVGARGGIVAVASRAAIQRRIRAKAIVA